MEFEEFHPLIENDEVIMYKSDTYDSDGIDGKVMQIHDNYPTNSFITSSKSGKCFVIGYCVSAHPATALAKRTKSLSSIPLYNPSE